MGKSKESGRRLTPQDIDASKRLYNLWKLKRADLGYQNQGELAKQIGVTQGAISHWMTGKAAIGVGALLKLSAALKIDPTEINPDFEYTKITSDLSPDVARIAQKLETLPEGVRSDIERTIDSIMQSNYMSFIKRVNEINQNNHKVRLTEQRIPASRITRQFRPLKKSTSNK